jgi:hypothetical protein
MKQFIIKLSVFTIFGAIPFLLLIGGYLYFDPFKVIRKYNSYTAPYVLTNRDYVSTEMFFNNYNKYAYNSFIFGSSRTVAFRASSWKKKLHPQDSPFSFDASAENIYGIYTKIKLLDSLHVKIDNALVLLCRDASFRELDNTAGHIFIKDPRVAGGNKWVFQAVFLKAYLTPYFLYCFYDYEFTHQYKEHMKGFIEDRRVTFDSVTNEMDIVDQEQEIIRNPQGYYEKKKSIFYPRHGETTDSVQQINASYQHMLEEIRNIFVKNHTDYKIILSPLYDEMKFSNEDMRVLHNLYGKHLYDFTGKNYFTDDITHYYENSHFRPAVGDSIMSVIYGKNSL